MNNIITKRVENKLTSGLKIIDEKYPNIIYGGCGLIGKWIGEAFLKKGATVDYLILDSLFTLGVDVEMFQSNFELYGNILNLNDLKEHGLEVDHILPIINGKLFVDTKGIATSIDNTYWNKLTVLGKINHDTLIRWNKDLTYTWNYMFMESHRHELLHIEKDIKDLIKSLRI